VTRYHDEDEQLKITVTKTIMKTSKQFIKVSGQQLHRD